MDGTAMENANVYIDFEFYNLYYTQQDSNLELGRTLFRIMKYKSARWRYCVLYLALPLKRAQQDSNLRPKV